MRSLFPALADDAVVPPQPEPVAPPMTPSSPINEPEPDRLPDETPVPNPDEYDRPAKIMILRWSQPLAGH